MEMGTGDIIGPADESREAMEVSDADILGPADGESKVAEVSDADILGPADEEGSKEFHLPGAEKWKGPETQETKELGKEVMRERFKELKAEQDEIKKNAEEAKNILGDAERTPVLPVQDIALDKTKPLGKSEQPAEDGTKILKPEESPPGETEQLAGEVLDAEKEAADVAREGALEAISSLEVGEPARIDAIVSFLEQWPDKAAELGGLGMKEAESAVVALKLFETSPEMFVKSFESNDFSLSADEKLTIAESIRDQSPQLLVDAVKVMDLPTKELTELLMDSPEDQQVAVLQAIEVPTLGDAGALNKEQLKQMEARETKELQRIREFDQVGRALAMEVLKAFPERAERERERLAKEEELTRDLTSARDFADTSTAPRAITMEGKLLPAVYKSAEREMLEDAKVRAEYKEAGVEWPDDWGAIRPGIEAGTTPGREWLTYQIDKALGLDIVPSTVVRDGPEGIGSAQDWEVGDSMAETPWLNESRANPELRKGLEKIAFLDIITENSDRHTKNFLRGKEGKIIAIDNGNSFGKPKSEYDGPRSNPLWAVEGQVISSDLRKGVEDFRNAPELQKALQKAFDTALGKDGKRAWQQFNKRLKQLESDGYPTDDDLRKEGNVWPDKNRGARAHYERLGAEEYLPKQAESPPEMPPQEGTADPVDPGPQVPEGLRGGASPPQQKTRSERPGR